MTDSLYTSYAEVLSLCTKSKDDLTKILDHEQGFAARMHRLCRDQFAQSVAGKPPQEPLTPELEALKMERDTWALVQMLMSHRRTTGRPRTDARHLLQSNPYTPPSTLAQSIIAASPVLSELFVVREWLQHTAPVPDVSNAGALNGYWRFTKIAIMQGLRTGQRTAGIVTEMDPDAVNRGGADARGLAGDDASDEKELVHMLFALVRAGRLTEAAQLCRRAKQPWRAASINGSLLLRWRALAKGCPGEEDSADSMDVDEGWNGNVRRKLWKTTCTRAALNPTLSTTERALYAALAPSPQTAASLKAACRTWSDHLWALISVACEDRLTAAFASLERKSFWEGGLAVVDIVETPESTAGTDSMEVDDAVWEQEVVGALESLQNTAVEEGPPGDNPFHVTQLQVILNRADALMEGYAKELQAKSLNANSTEYPAMTRFFAHLCLYFRMVDIPISPDAVQVILEAYLQVLEAKGERELIAMYAAAMGTNAVDRYASFLTSLDVSVSISDRRAALARARDHGLDMQRVAEATTQRTIAMIMEQLPGAEGPLPSAGEMAAAPSDVEMMLVRAVEWTTFMEATYTFALERTNAILRYLLARGRLQPARRLISMLPRELAQINEPENEKDATEYLHYRMFFVAWDALAKVEECRELEAAQTSREGRAAWLDAYKDRLRYAREQVKKLLTEAWLRAGDKSPGDPRRREFARIRQIYVPELIIRLHKLLVEARRYFPESLKHALLFANIVADSRYKLTEDFVASQDGKRLGEYLMDVREAVLAGLERGGSDPYRVLH